MNPNDFSSNSLLPRLSGILSAIGDAEQFQEWVLDLLFQVIPAARAAFLPNDPEAGANDSIRQICLTRGLDVCKSFRPDREVLARASYHRTTLMQQGSISIICAPLMLSGITRGFLYIDDEGLGTGFRAEDELHLKEIAAVAVKGLAMLREVESLRDERDLFQEAARVNAQIIGVSKKIRDLRQSVEIAGQSDKPVIIAGTPGSGKELVARCIHQISGRASKLFVRIDCSGDAALIAKDLFGDTDRKSVV